jgi:hypothetical protein
MLLSLLYLSVGMVTMEKGIALEKGKFPDLKIDVSDPAVLASLIPVQHARTA